MSKDEAAIAPRADCSCRICRWLLANRRQMYDEGAARVVVILSRDPFIGMLMPVWEAKEKGYLDA